MSKKPSLPGADALFGPPKTPQSLEKQEDRAITPKLVKEETSKHVNKQKSRTAKSEQEGLVKYSLYFTPKLLEKLDDVWFKLRKSRPEKITKWKLANLILDAGLDDAKHIERLLDEVQND